MTITEIAILTWLLVSTIALAVLGWKLARAFFRHVVREDWLQGQLRVSRPLRTS